MSPPFQRNEREWLYDSVILEVNRSSSDMRGDGLVRAKAMPCDYSHALPRRATGGDQQEPPVEEAARGTLSEALR
jgi:hypothetical protein